MKTLRAWLNSPDSNAIARGMALFLGAFALLGLLAKWRAPAFDPNLWWVDLRALPAWCADSLVGALAILLLAWGTCRWLIAPARAALTGLLAFFSAVTLMNAAIVWVLLAQGRIHSTLPVPLSLLFAGGLLFIAYQVRRKAVHGLFLLRVAACFACALAFPLLQVLGFGKTDYRRSADVAVVFGARAYANGKPSDALADRVRTACELYKQGLVRQLVFSGGPGDGAIHETESMRRMAIGLGVPDSAILRDEAGLNTSATLRNTKPLLAEKTAIAVSEFYHLPRIKLAAAANGVDLLTVPARPVHWTRQWPLANMLREVPAFWLYYVRGVSHVLTGRSQATGSPLTPALSPLRGEGVATDVHGRSVDPAAFSHRSDAQAPNAASGVPFAWAAHRAPSPLNGERAGERGEDARDLRLQPIEMQPHPRALADRT